MPLHTIPHAILGRRAWGLCRIPPHRTLTLMEEPTRANTSHEHREDIVCQNVLRVTMARSLMNGNPMRIFSKLRGLWRVQRGVPWVGWLSVQTISTLCNGTLTTTRLAPCTKLSLVSMLLALGCLWVGPCLGGQVPPDTSRGHRANVGSPDGWMDRCPLNGAVQGHWGRHANHGLSTHNIGGLPWDPLLGGV